MNFADLIKQGRKRRGISFQKLADEIGVNVAYVHRWENGKAMPRPDYYPAIAKALRVDAESVWNAAAISRGNTQIESDTMWVPSDTVVVGDIVSGKLSLNDAGLPRGIEPFKFPPVTGDPLTYLISFSAPTGAFKKGDFAIVSPGKRYSDGDIVVVGYKNEGAKKHMLGFLKSNASSIRLMGLNNQENISVDDADILYIHKVIGHVSLGQYLALPPDGESPATPVANRTGNKKVRWSRLTDSK